VGGDRRCTVQALQPKQVATGIDDGDGHGPLVFQGLGFGGGADGLEVGQFEKMCGFHKG